MIFKGIPNQFVRFSNKYVQRATGRKGFIFDENGKYETENEFLIKILKQHFEVEEDKEKLFYCKKCDFETDNRGLLMAHYREHKREE